MPAFMEGQIKTGEISKRKLKLKPINGQNLARPSTETVYGTEGAFEWPMMNLRPVQLVVKIVLLAETSAAMSINPSIILGRVFAAHATHLTDGEKGSDQKQLERVLSDRL